MGEREEIQVDVLFVGAGPASLSGAYHLQQLIQQYNHDISSGKAQGKPLDSISVAVIEKSQDLGGHILSGAVMDPRALKELIPDYLECGIPLDATVRRNELLFLTKKSHFRFPITPKFFENKGYHLVSLGKLVEWLGAEVENRGADIFLQTPGRELLFDGNRVTGVRTQSLGVSKTGTKKPNFQKGVDIKAKITILGEGVCGNLSESVIDRLKLRNGKNPPCYSVGVKEMWEVTPSSYQEGKVVHTLGYPLDAKTFGGSWIYHFGKNRVSLGFVTGLDYQNPYLDIHEEFQRFKKHPMIAKMLEGGRMISYGSKAIFEGGYFSMPKLYGDGFLLVGESAGFLNSGRLKGIHLAMKSGMLAAETALTALIEEDFSETVLSHYEKNFRNSWAGKELWKVRNFYQSFQRGLPRGIFHLGLQMLSGGRGLHKKYSNRRDDEAYRQLLPEERKENGAPKPKPVLSFDGKLTFNTMDDLYLSGVYHEEDQPSHIIIKDPSICHDRCRREYGNPCQYFCPANVFEIEKSTSQLRLNPSNCLHCKTCVIKDPYQIVEWVTPEGGGGPRYKGF